jgi:hypothetical protein
LKDLVRDGGNKNEDRGCQRRPPENSEGPVGTDGKSWNKGETDKSMSRARYFCIQLGWLSL